ncbi:glycoside hydrolase family 3 protein [Microbacterium murale]|uniref:Beta-glucosidase n=1 Tax=Microbacterium murale TaxID=1081040 RepID=A0ABU0P6B3_9MICO|nr:glycoside hydrolase family 3 N-terminal domain-containing protein [Microbacterium murale]MDQ0642234.1 beta-glucosidase [Microbacterium murale]
MTSANDLSLRERVGQINQRLKGWEAVRWIDGEPRITDVLRREVDRWGGLGAIYGVLRADPWSQVRWRNGIPPERSAEAYHAVQDYVMRNGTGIPTLFVEEAPHGLMALGATTLPVNLALGATMDLELAEHLGEKVAAEARARGAHVALVSGLDVLRDPRWGRAEECFSEDPWLAAAFVRATVRGMQGSDPHAAIDRAHIAVVAKHLAAQGAGIGGRNGSGAPIGRRELGEVHLRPAYAAARAGVAGFMAAYNDIDGIPCSANRELLTGRLREDWGWEGIVMADGTAIDRLRDSTPDAASAAAISIHAGVDLSLWDDAFTHVVEAVERGLLAEGDVTRAADRVLALKTRVGLLSGTGESSSRAAYDVRELITLAARAATESVVIVHDREKTLPLAPSAIIALVGPNADDIEAQLGDYSPPRPAEDPDASTVRTALIRRYGAGNVRFAPGSTHRHRLGDDALTSVTEACAGADVAIVVLGGTSRRSYEDEFAVNGAVDAPAVDTTNGEGVDQSHLALPAAQLEVLRAARAASSRVVAVIIDGRPRPLTEVAALSDALIVAPFPGPSGGQAIVDALQTGSACGLLPATFPSDDGVLPVAHDERRETARGYVDARYPVGHLLGAGAPKDVTVLLRPSSSSVTRTALSEGAVSTLIADVVNDSDSEISLAVPLFGRRHEYGIRPRRRTVLDVRRVRVPAGGSTAVRFALGLDALGSWATGRPEPSPVEVIAWTAAQHDPPEDVATVRITEDGDPG